MSLGPKAAPCSGRGARSEICCECHDMTKRIMSLSAATCYV